MIGLLPMILERLLRNRTFRLAAKEEVFEKQEMRKPHER